MHGFKSRKQYGKDEIDSYFFRNISKEYFEFVRVQRRVFLTILFKSLGEFIAFI